MNNQTRDKQQAKPTKVALVKSFVKETKVQVGLNEQDTKDLDKAVLMEQRRRKDPNVGRATILRESAMPRIREIISTTNTQEEAAA